MSIARPDRAFFFIAAACALAYVSLPRDTAYYDRWYQLFPVAAVVATLVGVWLNRPRSRTPMYLVAVSGLCAVTADALYAIELERAGVLRREVRDTRPPHVEYVLTPDGRRLEGLLEALVAWARA